MDRAEFRQYADLLVSARSGDDNAFREIYQKTRNAQLHHLTNILGPSEDIMDALQEVYTLLYQNMDKINPPTLLIAYLNRLSYFVGKNQERRHIKHQNNTISLDWLENMEGKEESDVYTCVEKKDRIKTVQDAIISLPEQEQNVVFMRYYQKLKHQEVALSLGISQASAKRLQHSAQKHLRAILKEHGITSLGVVVAEAYQLEMESSGTAGSSSAASSSPLISGAAGGGSAIHAGAAVCALSAVVIGGTASIGSPAIKSIDIPKEMTNKAVTVNVTADSIVPIKEIKFESADGKVAYGVRLTGNTYTAPVSANGPCRITLKTNNGRTTSELINVDNLDKEMPAIADILTEGETTKVVFAPDKSGIDFGALYCEEDGGAVIKPLEANPEANYAVFRLSDRNHTLYYKDRAGNSCRMPLYFKNDDSKSL